MATSSATTVDAYLASLPEDRRAAMSEVIAVVRANLAPGIEEGMQYGMIGWYIPLSRYPDTYNGQPLSVLVLASQKASMSLYLQSVYGDPATRAWFEEAYRASGKRMDVGQSCVRFRTIDDLPLDVIAEAVRRITVDGFIASYEAARAAAKSRPRSASSAVRETSTETPSAKKRTRASKKPPSR